MILRTNSSNAVRTKNYSVHIENTESLDGLYNNNDYDIDDRNTSTKPNGKCNNSGLM
jgi:hypothetical protein